MAQDRACLAWIVVAVVAEVHDAPADLRLQASRGPDLGHEEAPREESAGLLAERDDRPHAIVHVGGPEMAPPPPNARGDPGNPGRPSIPGVLIRACSRRRRRAVAGPPAAPRSRRCTRCSR